MQYETLAAVDLGSNSFHLQIGRVVEDQIYLLDGLREPVRLGAGLTRDKRIDRATQVRALDALRRFSDRLRGFPGGGGARGRHQCAARGQEFAPVPGRGQGSAGFPDRNHRRARGSAADLPGRGAQPAAEPATSAW